MSTFYCDKCEDWCDADYVGYNAPEESQEQFCDECWDKIVHKLEYQDGLGDYLRDQQIDREGR